MFRIILYSWLIGFLTNSILQRAIGTISTHDILFPIGLLVSMGVLLTIAVHGVK